MGLLDKYNKTATLGANNSGLIRNPNTPLQSPNSNPSQVNTFNKTNLDLENNQPLGGPINVPYTTRVGGINNGEIKTFTTTQPFTPKNTYIDSLQDDRLIARARDPFK